MSQWLTMVSPTQLCWRYHSLSLRQRYENTQNRGIYSLLTFNEHLGLGGLTTDLACVLIDIAGLALMYDETMDSAVHDHLVLPSWADGLLALEPLDLDIGLGEFTLEGHVLRNVLDGLVLEVAYKVHGLFCYGEEREMVFSVFQTS